MSEVVHHCPRRSFALYVGRSSRTRYAGSVAWRPAEKAGDAVLAQDYGTGDSSAACERANRMLSGAAIVSSGTD